MKFTIPITPVGQMRPRACIRGRHASVYKAKEQEQAERTMEAFLVDLRPPEPMTGPLLLYLDCHFPIPQSKSRKWKDLAARGIERPNKKPDADNLAKHIEDVLTQMRFWEDDKQVVELVVRKWYSSRPRWEVRLEPCRMAPLGFPEDDAA